MAEETSKECAALRGRCTARIQWLRGSLLNEIVLRLDIRFDFDRFLHRYHKYGGVGGTCDDASRQGY
jgi:hypothetical protein